MRALYAGARIKPAFIAVAISIIILANAGCGGGVGVTNPSTTTNTSTPPASSAPQVSLNPTSLSFGDVPVGTNTTRGATLSNTGNAALTVSTITASGDFRQTNNCATVAAGSSCQITVTFSPTMQGTRNGTLTITDNAAGSPRQLPLSGNGVAPGQLLVTPASIDFGSIVVGTTSSQTVQLKNTGVSAVSVSSGSTSGPGFSISGLALPLSLAGNQSVSFTVRFAPSNSGTATGSVQFVNSSATSPVTLPLTGTAVAPVAHSVTLSWHASTSSVVGYNVYRGGQSGGPYSRINPNLVGGTTYADSSVTHGQTYYYVVTSVASGNLESGYSNQVTAVIPAP